MRILPREVDKLLLHHASYDDSLVNGSNLLFQAGSLAQKRLARGLKLNLTEATALIASVLQERIRDGDHSVAELMQHGKTLLGRRHVQPGVMHQLHEIQVEGTFPDGSVS
jgi:urease